MFRERQNVKRWKRSRFLKTHNATNIKVTISPFATNAWLLPIGEVPYIILIFDSRLKARSQYSIILAGPDQNVYVGPPVYR